MLYLGINYYESEIMKKNQQISSLNVELYHASNELSTLSENNLSLKNENIQLSNELMALSDQNLQSIEPLREYDKQAYMMMYDEIYYTLNERPQTIYENTSTDEFDMICRVIEAEIGNGNIDQKINVATCIINRYRSGDKTWYEVLTENHQFTTVSNGAWNRVDVTESTRLALEYAWLFPNEELGDATYFKSGSDSWHDNCGKLEEVYNDKKHKFYVERERIIKMTLGEYLNENTDIKNFCILMLGKDDNMTTIEYGDVSEVDHDLLHCEFMEANVDDGTLGIWVR